MVSGSSSNLKFHLFDALIEKPCVFLLVNIIREFSCTFRNVQEPGYLKSGVNFNLNVLNDQLLPAFENPISSITESCCKHHLLAVLKGIVGSVTPSVCRKLDRFLQRTTNTSL